jgi:hypothetical protein
VLEFAGATIHDDGRITMTCPDGEYCEKATSTHPATGQMYPISTVLRHPPVQTHEPYDPIDRHGLHMLEHLGDLR